jgi:antitoxin (DNA-binding transcriptional repressor) of toxin-antitoxin stability system
MVNIYEAKARLSEFIEAAERGERVLICRRNRPVAELRATRRARTTPRPIGLDAGRFEIPDTFFEPLSDDLLEAFETGPVFPKQPVAPERPTGPGKRSPGRKSR